MSDIFGDLREWGTILNKLDRLTQTGNLEKHQRGLVRLLRYRFNWQLRLAAIQAAATLRAPSPEVADALLRVVGDEYSELGTRVSASDAVCDVMRTLNASSWPEEIEESIRTFTDSFLGGPQSPTLRNAVERWLALLPVPGQHTHSAGTCRPRDASSDVLSEACADPCRSLPRNAVGASGPHRRVG